MQALASICILNEWDMVDSALSWLCIHNQRDLPKSALSLTISETWQTVHLSSLSIDNQWDIPDTALASLSKSSFSTIVVTVSEWGRDVPYWSKDRAQAFRGCPCKMCRLNDSFKRPFCCCCDDEKIVVVEVEMLILLTHLVLVSYWPPMTHCDPQHSDGSSSLPVCCWKIVLHWK